MRNLGTRTYYSTVPSRKPRVWGHLTVRRSKQLALPPRPHDHHCTRSQRVTAGIPHDGQIRFVAPVPLLANGYYPSLISSSLRSSCRQPRLHLIPLLLLHLPEFLPRGVEPRVRLVERVLGTALELLPDQILPLLLPQALVLLLQLRHASGLVRRVRGLESPLRVSVDLFRRVGGGEGEGVEGVVDAGGVEGGVGG